MGRCGRHGDHQRHDGPGVHGRTRRPILNKDWILGVVLSGAALVTLLISRDTAVHAAALVTVAGGWALVLWRPGAVFRTNVPVAKKAEGGLVGLSNEFHTVLDQLSGTFDDQLTKAERELAQLRRLLGDAVDRLTQAVTFFKEQIAAQQELLEKVAGHSGSLICRSTTLAIPDGASASGDGAVQVQRLVEDVLAMSDNLAIGVAELWRVKGTLEKTLEDAVMALQFEDISTQLAAHVVDRIEYLRTLLLGIAKIEETMGEDMTSTEGTCNLFQRRLDRMREALHTAGLLIERVEHVAVHQETLDAGEVELF
jgi:hypothetical protein